MKLLVPLDTSEGIASKISDHFGKAKYVAIIKVSKENIEIAEISAFSKVLGKTLADYAIEKGINGVIVKGIGFRAFEKLASSGVKIYKTSCENLECLFEELSRGSLEEAGPRCPF